MIAIEATFLCQRTSTELVNQKPGCDELTSTSYPTQCLIRTLLVIHSIKLQLSAICNVDKGFHQLGYEALADMVRHSMRGRYSCLLVMIPRSLYVKLAGDRDKDLKESCEVDKI